MSKLKLRIGSRPGWPGTKIASYVTHAVYQVRTTNGTWSPVKGYGKSGGTGQIINDATAAPNATYKWYDPAILLQKKYVELFEAEVLSACTVYYTGIGGNCYSPIVRGLQAVEEQLKADGASGHAVTDVSRILSQLMGSNYGMGTRITNKMIFNSLALFTILGAVYLASNMVGGEGSGNI